MSEYFKMIDHLLEYGIAVVVIVSLLGMMFLFGKWFAKHMEHMSNLHRDERDEWRQTVERVTDQQDKRQHETNTILRDLTLLIEGRLLQGDAPKLRAIKK